MTTNPATIDQIQYLFTFPFKDPDWKRKFLIGFLLYLAGFIVPIIPWVFFSGYMAKIIQIGIEGDDYVLPEWDDWGDLFTLGLKLMGVGFLAALPFIILFGCGYLSMMSPAFLSGFAPSSYEDEISAIWIFGPMLSMFGGMCAMGLGIFLSLLVGILVPPAMSHVIAEDEFTAAFRVSEWLRIFKANLGGYIIAYIIIMGTSFMLSFAFQLLYMTFVLCCTIPLVMSLISVYLGIVMGAIFGQTYRVGKENLDFVLLPEGTGIEESAPLPEEE
jgi:hypothetical protein